MDDKIRDNFLRLVRYSIGAGDEPVDKLSPGEWQAVYRLAVRHALVGVCATGIERMDDSLRPPLTLTMHWAMGTVAIEKRGRLLNGKCVELAAILEGDGQRACMLKGQGAALYYPNPMRRQGGDIDVWVGGGHRRVMAYLRSRFPAEGAYYHHADFPVFPEVSVELHFTPSWMSSPLVNRRLQRWFRQQADRQFANRVELPEEAGSVCVPDTRFNVVYMLLHVYRHLFAEGIGLRQCLDYYYVLMHFSGAASAERTAAVTDIRRLGLGRFAAAFMYVLGSVFAMPQEWMLVQPSASDGRFVLSEILRAGNFGVSSGIDRSHGRSFGYFVSKLRYRLRFLFRYPGETLWGFWFTLWSKLWRVFHGYVS